MQKSLFLKLLKAFQSSFNTSISNTSLLSERSTMKCNKPLWITVKKNIKELENYGHFLKNGLLRNLYFFCSVFIIQVLIKEM